MTPAPKTWPIQPEGERQRADACQSRTEDAVHRIREMEPLLDECARAAGQLSAQLDSMKSLRGDMIKLFQYYGSADWHADREADERGELPAGLRRGVLSEDLIYDLITDVRDSAIQMLELSADILKNWI